MACQHMQGKGRCCYDFPFFFLPNLSFIYIMQLLKRAPGLSISTKNIFVATYIRCRVRERKKKKRVVPSLRWSIFPSPYQVTTAFAAIWRTGINTAHTPRAGYVT